MSTRDEVFCAWEWYESTQGFVPGCLDERIFVTGDRPTRCPGCGLRVKEIEGQNDDEAERDNYSHGPLS